MNLIVWLVLGGVVGWLASLLMRMRGRPGIVLNVVVGLVGAFLAGWFVAPLAGLGSINLIEFSTPSLLVSLGGALLTVVLVSLLRKSFTR